MGKTAHPWQLLNATSFLLACRTIKAQPKLESVYRDISSSKCRTIVVEGNRQFNAELPGHRQQ